jgi:hypothetical protein
MDGVVKKRVDDGGFPDVSNGNNLHTIISHIITVALTNELNKYIHQ